MTEREYVAELVESIKALAEAQETLARTLENDQPVFLPGPFHGRCQKCGAPIDRPDGDPITHINSRGHVAYFCDFVCAGLPPFEGRC